MLKSPASTRLAPSETDPDRAPAAAVPWAGIDWEASTPSGWYPRWGHRALDLVLLVLVLPPALCIGLAVAAVQLVLFRDPAQVFFRQKRVGYRGRVFTILKFRTMREARGLYFSSWETGGDRLRVTRFGRFLRNSHLDELPQVLHVLRGEMSFIGPRPEMVEIESWAAEHVPGFATRLAVRPGITGLAQVTQGYAGSSAEAYREKFRVSDGYRRRQSLWLDLSIVVRTALWMLRGRGWRWRSQSGSGKPAGAAK